MYVLIVSRRYPSDQYPLIGIFEADQAKALKAAGHKVIYAGIDLQSVRVWRKWGLSHFQKDGIGIYEISIPIGARGGPAFVNAVGRWAFNKLYTCIEKAHGRPDIIHAHFFKHAILINDICRNKGIPFVVTEHSSLIGQGKLDPRLVPDVITAYRDAERVIAVSENLKSRIYELSGVTPSVLPNIVDTDTFRFRANTYRKDKRGPFRFVSTGNLLEGKGFDLLLCAFSELLKTIPDCKLTIYGDGPEKAHLRAIIDDLSINESVQLALGQPRCVIAEGYAQADAFVLASRHETFGVVYIEAMAAGLPVIATRCGGPEGFVTPETGIVTPPEDSYSLREAMQHLVEHSEEYDRNRIAEYAVDNFSPSVIGRRLTEVYEVVAKHREDGRYLS